MFIKDEEKGGAGTSSEDCPAQGAWMVAQDGFVLFHSLISHLYFSVGTSPKIQTWQYNNGKLEAEENPAQAQHCSLQTMLHYSSNIRRDPQLLIWDIITVIQKFASIS